MKPSARLSAILFLAPALLSSQAISTGPQAPFGQSIHQVLVRSSDGHSPSADEIAAEASLEPMPSSQQVKAALPDLEQALKNPDTPVRLFALTALTGIQVAPDANLPGHPQVIAGAPVPTIYKPDVAELLAPLIPQIATHLTEESEPARDLTVKVLSGFAPNPPATVYEPLYAYLRRDDAVGSTGTSVVELLLHCGPLTAATQAAVAHYLHRSDQTPDSRANLVDTIASATNQSQALNKGLLDYMDGDDPTLEARLILSLPALDLTPEVFADMQSRVAAIAGDSAENLQVVNAAKAVQPCWTHVKMTTGCPVY